MMRDWEVVKMEDWKHYAVILMDRSRFGKSYRSTKREFVSTTLDAAYALAFVAERMPSWKVIGIEPVQ
jgi:hypothetical protein